MVGIACVFDFLDGLLARSLNVHSEIGKQLDSLADMVSFGVVPGVIIWKLLRTSYFQDLYIESNYDDSILKQLYHHGHIINQKFFFPLFAFIITIFSAIRLAKFNLDTRQIDSFIGLPTPANTIFISSLALILNLNSTSETIKQLIINPYFLISLSIISSFLLVAPLPLFALKFKNFSWADNKVRYIFLAFALVLLVVFQLAGIPLIIILYILLSVINNIISKRKTPL